VTVRVCYLSRGALGASIRSLRLVGHASDEVWEGGPSGDPDQGAQWVRTHLASLRSTNTLALLCLDVEGGVCSWLTSPSSNAALIGAIARGGNTVAADPDSPARAGSSAVDFYAADPYSSSIQALSHANGAAHSHRLPVLAITDAPARLLMDALDRVNIGVDATATLWHLIAHTWDPGAPRTGTPMMPADVTPSDAPVTAVVLVDPDNARLLWTWSRAGRLMVAGSMRLRRVHAETTAIAEAGSEAPAPLTVSYSQEDASRLAIEWLSWAAQVGQAPSRVVCILPEQTQAGSFGRAIGQAWNGATVDVVVRPDPIGDTLTRGAGIIENTPKATDDDPQLALVELSSRPGRSHRRLFMWWSAAVMAAAVALGFVGYRLQQNAEQSREAAASWQKQQLDAVTQVMPGAKDGVGVENNVYNQLKAEVTKRSRALDAPARNDVAVPILQELETISFVIGNNNFALENLDLDTRGARVTILTGSTSEAEAVVEAFRRIAGSNLVDWSPTFSNRNEGETVRIRGVYTSKWSPQVKPEVTPR
jgi:hypothetical protein